MRIISTFLSPEAGDLMEGKQHVTMLFDALVNDKSLIVGITIGRVERPDLSGVVVSPIGQSIIDRMLRHRKLNYPDGLLMIAGVAQVPGAKERVRQILSKAPDKASVLLVCANDKVYDAAFPALNVDFQSTNMNTKAS